MNRFNTPTWLGTLPCLFIASLAQAQAMPDAGSLQRQIEREHQGALPQKTMPAPSPVQRDLPPVSGPVVQVQSFRFVGNTLLSAEQLTAAVAPYSQRALDFAQLQNAIAAVAEAYRAAGWVVKTYLPEQDIQGGVVTVQVVETQFGGVVIEGESKRIAAKRLVQGVQAQQALGQPLNAWAIDRAILLADDLPGVAVSGALRAGQRYGETELVYKVADEPALTGDVRADNTGARSTGASRLSANLLVNSPEGWGDQLALSAALSEGSRYGRAAYSVSLGDDGWRVGANASALNYTLIGLDGKGTSQTMGLEARYPIVRARQHNLYLSINADQKQFDNQFNGATSTQYGMETATVGLSGNLFDDLAGGGANTAILGWTSGHRNNQVGTTSGGFNKLRYSLSRQQALTPALSWLVALDGQASGDSLDTSEAFYLGGAYGVRAYPSNEGRGSSGDLLKLELRWRADDSIALTGFYDYGRVRNHDGTSSYSLKGAGMAVAWQASGDLSLAATLAHRIGANPSPNPSTGNDQDGTLNKNRFWLSATLTY